MSLCHDGISLPPPVYSPCDASQETVPIKQSTVIGLSFGIAIAVLIAVAVVGYLYLSKKKAIAYYSSLGSQQAQPPATASVEPEFSVDSR